MASYVATGRVTISDGSVINKNKGEYFNSSVFLAGDTVTLNKEQEKKYGHLFAKAKETAKTKEAKTGKNK